jgi:hypothetical protein
MKKDYLVKVKQVPLYMCAVDSTMYFHYERELSDRHSLFPEQCETFLRQLQEIFPTLELVLEPID